MCERLCDADGPDVCTEGSKLIRGICTNYYFQSDVIGAEYCYKSRLTRPKKCRVTEYPVRVTDVPRLLVLPAALYARILKRELTLEDISEDQPDLFELLKTEPADMVRTRLNDLIPRNHAPWVHALHQGFSQALPLGVLEDVMSLKDIQSVIYGDPEPDLHDFVKNVKLQGFTPESVEIQFLWRMMERFRSVRSSPG